MSLGASVLLLYPFNKYIKFGSGFSAISLKVICNVGLFLGPSLYLNSRLY